MHEFSRLSASERALALLDPGSVRISSAANASRLTAGSGSVGGKTVYFALLDGHQAGGTIGQAEAEVLARLAGIVQRAGRAGKRSVALLVGFDTGGVRVQEGPRALAAASGVGVALARLTLSGVPVIGIVSGPRGCFGAPSVMACLPDYRIMLEQAHWGLTGPRLFADITPEGSVGRGLLATSARVRFLNGDASVVVPDEIAAVRSEVVGFFSRSASFSGTKVSDRLSEARRILPELRSRYRRSLRRQRIDLEPAPARRRKDFLSYSFRGHWRPLDKIYKAGLLQAAHGMLGDHQALGLVVGPEQRSSAGVGIEEAALITDMVAQVAAQGKGEKAVIFLVLFCQGHAIDIRQERFGLPRALAECLRSLVGARMLGHPILSILGGGTYGAAYLSLAAPSHRILALRGTSVAPMAPKVLKAFQSLRGGPGLDAEEGQLAELIPEVRTVESVIRLPRVVAEELAEIRREILCGADDV